MLRGVSWAQLTSFFAGSVFALLHKCVEEKKGACARRGREKPEVGGVIDRRYRAERRSDNRIFSISCRLGQEVGVLRRLDAAARRPYLPWTHYSSPIGPRSLSYDANAGQSLAVAQQTAPRCDIRASFAAAFEMAREKENPAEEDCRGFGPFHRHH